MGSEHPDWLPLDWKVSVKNRNFGRKDKCYIHPSNGLMFNSKPEVLQYLKISRESCNPKLGIKNTVAEKLPPGWIKEIRTKKSKGKTRRDPYYYDPVSGRQFRSMQEVFRYLKYSGKAESQKDDKDHSSTELVDNSQSSSAQSKGQRLIDERGDKIMTDQESIKSGRDDDVENVENPCVEERQGEYYAAEKPQNKLPRANGEERRNGERRPSNRLKDDAKDHSSEPAAENNTNIQESKVLEQREKENGYAVETPQHENIAPQNKRKLIKNSPRRTSKRLAPLEFNQSIEMKTSGEDGVSVDCTKIEGSSTDTAIKSCITDLNEQCRAAENPTGDKQKEPSEEEQKSVADGESSCLKDILLMDPCIEFAIKTLTGAIAIEDVNEGDKKADLCLEFAVKTLTGKDDGLK